MPQSNGEDSTPTWPVKDLLHEFEALSEPEQDAFLVAIIPGRIERLMHLIAHVARLKLER